MQVTAPDGRVWKVRRRPGRKPRWRRKPSLDVLDVPFLGSVGDGVAGFFAGIAVAIVIALVIAVLLPLVLFVGEGILVVLGIVVLAAPWRIEASTPGPPSGFKVWRIRGIWKSRRAVREVAEELSRGVEAAPEGVPA